MSLERALEEEFSLLWSMRGSMGYNDLEGMSRTERRWWVGRVERQLEEEADAMKAR